MTFGTTGYLGYTSGSDPQIPGVTTGGKRELQKALSKLGLKDKKRIKIIEELTKSVAESIVSVPTKTPEPKSK